MTAAGEALDTGDDVGAKAAADRKENANQALQDCSQKYNALRKKMRVDGWS